MDVHDPGGHLPTTRRQMLLGLLLAAVVLGTVAGGLLVLDTQDGAERPAERLNDPAPAQTLPPAPTGAPAAPPAASPRLRGEEDAPLIPGSRCGKREKGWVGMHRARMYLCGGEPLRWRQVD